MIWGTDPTSVFLHVDIQLSQYYFLEKSILSPLNGFDIFVENQLAIDVWFISELSILFHSSMCLASPPDALLVNLTHSLSLKFLIFKVYVLGGGRSMDNIL